MQPLSPLPEQLAGGCFSTEKRGDGLSVIEAHIEREREREGEREREREREKLNSSELITGCSTVCV